MFSTSPSRCRLTSTQGFVRGSTSAAIPYDGPQRGIPESLYLRDPDGIGIELLSDELMWFGGQWLDGRT